MSRYRKGCLYVRRLRLGDKGDFTDSIRMGYFWSLIQSGRLKAAYVLVRHGQRPQRIMAVGATRAEVEACLLHRHASFQALARAWRDDDARQPKARRAKA